MSVEPPAANGTIHSIGRTGQSSARAAAAPQDSAAMMAQAPSDFSHCQNSHSSHPGAFV